MNLSKLLLIHVYKDGNVVAQLVRRVEEASRLLPSLLIPPRLGHKEVDIKN